MNKTKSLTKWEEWVFQLKRSLGLIYDPDDYPHAPKPDFVPPPKKQATTTSKVVADDVTYNPRTGQYQRIVADNVTDKKTETATDKPKTVCQNTPTTNRQTTDNVTDKPKIVADNTPTIDLQYDDIKPTMSWEIMTTPTSVKDLNQTRQRVLTKADKLLLAERGLDEAKAQVVKEYWYQKKSRRVASEMLMKESKGYSERIVKDYYAVFNATTIEIESPTLEAK